MLIGNTDANFVFEHMLEGVVVQDANGKISGFNKSALKILELSEEELIGKFAKDPKWQAFNEDGSLLTWEQHPSSLALITGLPQKGFKLKVQIPNGKLKWLMINANPIIEQKKVHGVVVVFCDVTESISKQQAVNDEKLFLESILEYSPGVVYAKKPDGTYLFVNREFEKIFGIKREKILGFNDFDLFEEKFAKVYRENDLQIAHSLLPIHFDEEALHLDGLHSYHTVKFPVFNQRGELYALCGFSVDETPRRRLEKEVLDAKNRLEIAISSGGFGTWDWDIKSNTLIWDDYMYELFSVNKEDFEGSFQAYEKTVHQDDVARVARELEFCMKNKVSFSSEFRIKHPDGRIKIIRAESKTFYNENDEPIRLIGVNWDITREREKEILLIQNSKMSSLGEMSAGIAHEINNPLAIISAKAQIIKSQLSSITGVAPQIIQDLEIIHKTTERVSKIIRGLKAYARDAKDDPFVECSLKSILEETLSLCQEKLKNYQIKLNLSSFREDLHLDCRSTQISQVLLNFLQNSFDAIVNLQDRWINIDIRELGNSVEIEITDSGNGIPMEVQAKMMEPFFTTKAVGKGTGLGLSISQGIIASHHGRISLNKKSPHTSFIITLPKKQNQ